MTHDILSTGPDICFVFLFISGKDLNVTVDIKWEVEPSRYEVYILDSFLHILTLYSRLLIVYIGEGIFQHKTGIGPLLLLGAIFCF